MNKRNPFYNSEGYPDPTAYHGTKEIIKAENDLEKKVSDLVHVIHDIAGFARFEVVGRITFKHKKTGKEFR